MVLRKSIVRLFMTKRVLLLSFSSLSITSCHNSKIDHTINLDGEYFFSEDSNLSYYIPANFEGAYVKNESEYDSLLSTIHHPKLRESIDYYYRNAYVHPEATNAQYFYKEDSNNYAFLILNEIKHIRLNDLEMDYFKDYRNSSFRKTTKDSSAIVHLTADKFINTSDYQIMISRGTTKTINDSLFWEFYIVSKYLRTFTILTNSSEEIDFQPYLKATDYGDKRNSI